MLGLEKFFNFIQRWKKITIAIKVLAALGLAAFIYLDQCGTPISEPMFQQFKADLERDRKFTQAIEAMLPSGSMIYELPHITFPEGGNRNGVFSYDQFKPYLASNHLRWSFGGMRGRLAGDWYREVSALPVRKMLDKLAAAEFSGIYINWNGYLEDEQSRLESDLEDFLSVDPYRSADQTLSFYDIRTYNERYRAQFDQAGWDEVVYQVMNPIYRSFSVRFSGQFYDQEESDKTIYRWSGKRSGVEIQNLSGRDRTIKISFDVSTATNKPADLAIESTLWQKTYPIDGKPRILERDLTIRAGEKLSIAFVCNGDNYLQPNGDPRLVTFKFANFKYDYADQ